MGKTKLTKELERDIWNATRKQGVFGCFEVTIGWFGCERVDFLTLDTKDTWRCYEIKVSKSDFHSKAKKTFVGHYNYYVMPWELYQEVKAEIPKHIGVYCPGCSYVKKARKQEISPETGRVLKDSLLRSLYREAEKRIESNNPSTVERLRKQRDRYKQKAQEYQQKYFTLRNIGYQKYGPRWYKDDNCHE